MSKEEDFEAIKQFLEGDNRAFELLVVQYKDLVFNLCFRFLGDYDDAQDLAQDVFVKVFHALKGFRFKAAFSTWLYRITVNMCKNKLKSLEYRFKSKNRQICANDSAQPLEDIRTPEQETRVKEISSMIDQAIHELPLKHRLLIVLRDLEQKSYQEIASITGFKLGTVKSRLARARLMLKEKLRGVIE